jgi:hypothetical protein
MYGVHRDILCSYASFHEKNNILCGMYKKDKKKYTVHSCVGA